MKVKLCGFTHLADAQAAVDLGADLLGFNFYPASPRYIDPQACQALVAELRRPAGVQLVGVFVNSPVAEVDRILALCGLDLAQLSGDEPPEAVAALGGRGFKALRIAKEGRLDATWGRYPAGAAPGPAYLLDAAVPGQYGGTGQTVDWDLARAAARRAPVLLAGGLHPGNAAQAAQAVQPWGLDVASGIEAGVPGRKDTSKMQAFLAAAKAAAVEGRP